MGKPGSWHRCGKKLTEVRDAFEAMEVDQPHIDCLVKGEPSLFPLAIACKLKQESSVRLWKTLEGELLFQFWKKRTFWSDGYFVVPVAT